MHDISQYHKQFETIMQVTDDGLEYWSARDLMHILGYSKWENFLKVIKKAEESCKASGHKVCDHLPDVRKMIKVAKVSDLLSTEEG